MRQHDLDLSWGEPAEDERRFRRIVIVVLGAVLAAALIVPWLDSPERPLFGTDEVEPRFARLLVEERPAPPPPPPPPPEEPAAAPEPVPLPPVEAPPVEAPPVPVEEPPAPVVEPRSAARERAARSGLLALSDELAALRSDGLVQELETRPLQAAAPPAPVVGDERAIITSRAGAGSGGIDGSLPGMGDTQLEGRETTRVEAPVESASIAAPAARERLPVAPRSSEEIQRVFDQHRAALNTLYNRALRSDPTLAGTVVLKLTIVPSGDITDIEIVSSELADEDLERRLVARVRQFRFADRNVATTTITYPIDFFPG